MSAKAREHSEQRQLLRDIVNLRANINTLAGTRGEVTHEEAIEMLLEFGRRAERHVKAARNDEAQAIYDEENPSRAGDFSIDDHPFSGQISAGEY